MSRRSSEPFSRDRIVRRRPWVAPLDVWSTLRTPGQMPRQSRTQCQASQTPDHSWLQPIGLGTRPRNGAVPKTKDKAMTVYVIADIKVTDDSWVPAYAAS